MKMEESQMQAAFGERFARNSAWGMAGLGLFTAVAVVAQGGSFPFIAAVACVLLSYGFRRRARQEEERRNRALEDERDREFLARGNRGFRLAASLWMVCMGVALAFPPIRELVLQPPLRLPGLMVLGVIVANIADHTVVAMLYRRDRA